MVQPAASPKENRLLGLLPENDLRALEAKLEYIRLPLGKTLYEPGDRFTHVYFPTHGIISLLYVNESGASAELSVVGYDGMVGLGLLLGAERTTHRTVVEAAGHAYRLPASLAKAKFAESAAFQRVILWFFHAQFVHVSQTAICNLHHSVEQHFCRWLLLCLDRLDGNEIQMTHELIATMLGVRRQGVTEAAKRLQKRHIITYSRGRITVLDRPALESLTCECYEAVKRRIAASLPGLTIPEGRIQQA